MSYYDWLLGASPMHTASSASLTWRASWSIVEYTATHGIPISCAVLITRTAISPLFAIRIFSSRQVAFRAPPHFLDLRAVQATLCFGKLNFWKFGTFPTIKLHCELLIPLTGPMNNPFESKRQKKWFQKKPNKLLIKVNTSYHKWNIEAEEIWIVSKCFVEANHTKKNDKNCNL